MTTEQWRSPKDVPAPGELAFVTLHTGARRLARWGREDSPWPAWTLVHAGLLLTMSDIVGWKPLQRRGAQ